MLAPKLHVIDLATVEATTGLKAAIFVTELEHQHVELKDSALQIVQALKKLRKEPVSAWPFEVMFLCQSLKTFKGVFGNLFISHFYSKR